MSLLDVCRRENIPMIFPECHLLLCFSGFSVLARWEASACPFQAGRSVPRGMGSLGLHKMSHFSYSFCKSLGLVSTPWPVSTGLFTPTERSIEAMLTPWITRGIMKLENAAKAWALVPAYSQKQAPAPLVPGSASYLPHWGCFSLFSALLSMLPQPSRPKVCLLPAL